MKLRLNTTNIGFCVHYSVIFLLFFVFTAFCQSGALAQDSWRIEQLEASKLPAEIVPDHRARVKNGLPDGRLATADYSATIKKAWYSSPTRRYQHGILGDGIEGGGLMVLTASGKNLDFQLAQTQVFEDITPRLVDLDGDGQTEIITILSHVNKGASLAVFGVKNGEITLNAQSQYIGRPFRWLNIAGIGHYQGKNSLEIAIVVTPHIGGRLDLYGFDGENLKRIASAQGFSNHFIGSREQRLSASYRDRNKKNMILALPSSDRTILRIMAMHFDAAGNGIWKEIGAAQLPASINRAILVLQEGDNVEFTVGLSNGNVYLVSNH